MRLLSSLLIILVPTLVFGEFEALVDGVPKFKVHLGSAPSSVSPPTVLEQAIFDSPLKFENFSELMQCINSKTYTNEKILDLKPSVSSKDAVRIQTLQIENNKR